MHNGKDAVATYVAEQTVFTPDVITQNRAELVAFHQRPLQRVGVVGYPEGGGLEVEVVGDDAVAEGVVLEQVGGGVGVEEVKPPELVVAEPQVFTAAVPPFQRAVVVVIEALGGVRCGICSLPVADVCGHKFVGGIESIRGGALQGGFRNSTVGDVVTHTPVQGIV